MAAGTAKFDGHRRFVWFTPQGRNATEYEMFTVGQQSSPSKWLVVDWPIRFDDGRAPFTEESTALRCLDWGVFRDPSQTWQRPYVATADQDEQALGRLVPAALSADLVTEIDRHWLHEGLGRYLGALPFVEYGLFLATCYSVREALADTIEFAFAFEASDRLRHVQDIVHLLVELEEMDPSFHDGHARDAWMNDPALVPARDIVERVVASDDWGEISFVTNLVFEPLVADLLRTEFLSRNAARNGDPVTPMVLAAARINTERHRAVATELARVALADPEHGHRNRMLYGEWLARWLPLADEAAAAHKAIFALDGIRCDPFEPAVARTRDRHRAALAELRIAVER